MTSMIFIVTVPNIDEGRKIAKILIDNRIVACVNIFQNITSLYRWKGKVEEDNELLLIIKTTEEKSKLLINKIEEIHSYETPECIGFKIENGSKKYLNWIQESVK